MDDKTDNRVAKTMYDAFKKSGKIGYYMLYSALIRQRKDDGRS